RAAEIYPNRTAIVSGERRLSYAQFAARAGRLARALAGARVGRGAVVAALLPNSPEMLELHFGAPMAAGVLCSLNTRLDAATIAFILRHSQARVLVADTEYAAALAEVTPRLDRPVRLVWVRDAAASPDPGPDGEDYEAFIAAADP